MSKKKIMYIFNDTEFGGAGQSLVDTLVEIKKEVSPVVIIRSDAMVENKFKDLGVAYYKIDFSTDYIESYKINEENRQADIKKSYEAALELVPIIEKEKIQLIHINSSVSSFAAIAALIAKVPYVWHIRELLKEQYGCDFINEKLKLYLYNRASKLITISEYVKCCYQEKYNLDTLKMYNGLDLERFKVHLDKKRNFSNIFLAVGMITPEKGQWDAICATEYLIENGYSNIKLIIVGSGGSIYIWAIKKYIEKKELNNNIFILPFHNDLSELRNKASYAITCSQNEALGRVTLEAMLAGNIVIGAKSGGTTEIIGENEERGFLYELHNSKSLADTMIRAIKCSDETKRIILERAQLYSENNFNTKSYCKNLVKVYDDVIFSYEIKNEEDFLCNLKNYCMSIKESIAYIENENYIQCAKAKTANGILLKWLRIKQKGRSIYEYFRQHNIRNIAIYGMADIGCCLYDELENSNIEIKYLIDKDPKGIQSIIRNFVSLDEKISIDAIVVTVAFTEGQVVNELRQKGYSCVIGLSEILDELSNQIY